MPVISEASSAPARSREATRRRLLAAATRLFATRGVHGVTTHRIARSAGVASGTFYLHFKDKQALFREIAFEALAQLRERLDNATAAAGDDFGRAVRARAAELLSFAEERRDLVRILFGRDHEAADLGEDILEELASDVEAHLRARSDAGLAPERTDAGAAAQVIVGMWARIVVWWAEEPGRAPRDVVIETVVRPHLAIHRTSQSGPTSKDSKRRKQDDG